MEKARSRLSIMERGIRELLKGEKAIWYMLGR
jgi:hypothetical protein